MFMLFGGKLYVVPNIFQGKYEFTFDTLL